MATDNDFPCFRAKKISECVQLLPGAGSKASLDPAGGEDGLELSPLGGLVGDSDICRERNDAKVSLDIQDILPLSASQHAVGCVAMTGDDGVCAPIPNVYNVLKPHLNCSLSGGGVVFVIDNKA